DGASPSHDAGSDSGVSPDAATSVPTSLIAVNAALGLGDFRVCWSTGPNGFAQHEPFPSDRTKPIAQTNFPGIPVSGSVPIPIDSAMLTSSLTPYIVDAQRLEEPQYKGKTCAQLLCTEAGQGCMTTGEYWPLAPVQAFTFSVSQTNLFIVSGCRPSF